MKISTKYVLPACLIFCGCNSQQVQEVPRVEEEVVETISVYEYDYYSGYNAAISQFGGDSDKFVDLSNKRVVSYVSDHEQNDNGYADGYHRALDNLSDKNNSCPHVH